MGDEVRTPYLECVHPKWQGKFKPVLVLQTQARAMAPPNLYFSSSWITRGGRSRIVGPWDLHLGRCIVSWRLCGNVNWSWGVGSCIAQLLEDQVGNLRVGEFSCARVHVSANSGVHGAGRSQSARSQECFGAFWSPGTFEDKAKTWHS